MILAGLLLVISLPEIANTADPPERKYSMGALRISEFKGEGGTSSAGNAYTSTRTKFSYRFRVTRLTDNRFAAELESINVYSVFLPDSSWWNSPPNAELLDHEQGHFDIAEIAARRVQLAFQSSDINKIQGTGTTPKQAERSLVEKLRHVANVADKQIMAENLEYDSTTGHGSWRRHQKERRRIHQLTLEKLEKRLKPESRQTTTQASAN